VGCGSYTYEPPADFNTMRKNMRVSRSSGVRVSAFDDLRNVAAANERAAATGALGIERYPGTFILPSDKVKQTFQGLALAPIRRHPLAVDVPLDVCRALFCCNTFS
jgi:hypothetical protein